MKRFLCLLVVMIVVLGIGKWPEESDRVRTKQAPGLIGNKATLETLQWIWALERVPFPERIDSGQWTDYYFSNESGGDWGTGDNSNDGLFFRYPFK